MGMKSLVGLSLTQSKNIVQNKLTPKLIHEIILQEQYFIQPESI